MAEISAETWRLILVRVKEVFDIKDITYRTWLEPLTVYEVKGNTVVVSVPTGQMGIDYISKKFMFPLKAVIAEITGTDYEIEFILPEKGNEEDSRKTEGKEAPNYKAFEKAIEETKNRMDALEEKCDKARFRSTLALTIISAVSVIALCVQGSSWSKH